MARPVVVPASVGERGVGDRVAGERVTGERGAAAPGSLASPRGREIIDVAARLFHENGYDGTGMAQLAESCGMLKGSLYHYINTKEDLLFAIIDDVHQTALANIADWQPLDANAHVRLRLMIKGHINHIVENFVFAAVWLHEFRSLSPARQSVIVKERDVFEGYMRTLIRQGQAEGIICPDLDPKVVCMGIFGMMNWIYQWYSPGGRLDAEALADQFADLALGGLACGSHEHRPGHKRRLGQRPEAAGSTSIEADVDVDLAQVLVTARQASKRSAAR